MNYSNNSGRSQNFISFPNSSWGSFSSRYDRQPNYKKNGNTSGSNLNEQNNLAGESDPHYESNLGSKAVDGFKNFTGAGGGSFNTTQSNFNEKEFNSASYGNQNRNNNNSYQQNSNNFRFQQNQLNSNNFGTHQNRTNSNNFESQQNRSNSNDFGPRKYQPNFNNMNNSKNRCGSWLSGSGPKSFGNNKNKGLLGNSSEQNQSFNQNNNNGGGENNSNYVSFRKFRQHFSNNQNNTPKDETPTPSLFMGRDQSYPNELNNLMNPFFCGVCNSRLNSIKSANIHYESKAHDKQISNWMKKTFADKGMAVPEVQRFVTEETLGPYRCELCKLDLTSAQHALQHYNGKRHRQAATKVSPPTGIGYFNVDGNWVETGKVLDKVTGKETSYILVNTPTGFEPVVLHVAPTAVGGVKRPAEIQANNPEELPEKKPNLDTPQDAKMEKIKQMKEEQYRNMITMFEKNKQQQNTTNSITNNQFKTVSLDSQDSSSTGQTPQEALNSQQCKICGIATTSYDQMLLHLKGIRHTKKLRSLGEAPISDLFENSPTTILESLNSNNPSDVSMYRTPSGSYYCKTCNVALEDVARIKKHISSKVHLATVKKSVENPVES